YADLLRSRALTGAQADEAAPYIYTEGRRLESLSLKLLDMLVLDQQNLVLQPQSPAQLAQQLVQHLQGSFRAQNIHLQCRCQEGLCLLEGDLVKSLLVNLLDNARKALPQGGNIVISGKMLGDGYEYRVLDNGCGIPPQPG
ncbi:MAG: sensor histidine kinase, partial [Oscillospiraceae bacterium]|nr:sensor histidine kinase [Oscillospiraceae bacterium]